MVLWTCTLINSGLKATDIAKSFQRQKMAHTVTLILPLLLLTTSLSTTMAFNPCLYNREDVLPCLDWFNEGVLLPGPNEYTVHATRFQRGSNGLPICVRKKVGELLTDIEDLGTLDMKFLHSPGAELVPPMNYENQILQEFNVQCEPGRTAFIDFFSFDLEPKNCLDGSIFKCQDYVDIDAGLSGGAEYCGNVLPGLFTVASGEFILKLRTSIYDRYPGFQIFVTCFIDGPEPTTTAIESTTTTAESTTTTAESTTTTPESTTTTPESTSTINEATTTIDDNNTTDNLMTTTTTASEMTTSEVPTTATTRVKRRLSTLDTARREPLQRASLTKEEISTLRILETSLFRVALSQARRKITSWPPRSYSINEPEDIRTVEELRKLASSVEPATNLRTARSISSVDSKAEIGAKRQIRPRRKTVSIAEVELKYSATLLAVKNENAVNPIIRTVANSYTLVAQRLAPTQLATAREEFERSISPKPTVSL